MEEGIACCVLEHHFWTQAVCDAAEAFTGYEVLGGNDMVAQLDGLAEQLLVEACIEQSLLGGIA